MTQDLEGIFGELGISQYLDSFIEQGFDTWETILDITESDLDALAVKLGHRRKLQRHIANSRGHAPDVSLVSPTRLSIEDAKLDGHRPDLIRPDGKDVTVVTKRKYRRHPKPDDKAPERPPSAYVLFSNKMRDDVKGRSLTFTEIAKLVGENWQSLSAVEKEPFETQALKAKEKYNQDLVEYKKTPECKKYSQYLLDFKQKQASQTQATDASKRLKLEAGARPHHGSTTSAATPVSGSGTGSGSGSDSQRGGSEPRPARKRRVGSSISGKESQYSSTIPALSHQQSSTDEMTHSPIHGHFDRDQSPHAHGMSPRNSHGRGRRRSAWSESHPTADADGQPPHLPSLSDMFNDGRMVGGSPDGGNNDPFVPGRGRRVDSGSPLLRMHEQSSTGSISTTSSSSSYMYPRTPSDSTLPIHALLSNKSGPPSPYDPKQSPFFNGHLTQLEQISTGPPSSRPGPHGSQGFASLPSLSHFASAAPTRDSDDSQLSQTPVPGGRRKIEMNLDGMSALLRAGEIVGRQAK